MMKLIVDGRRHLRGLQNTMNPNQKINQKNNRASVMKEIQMTLIMLCKCGMRRNGIHKMTLMALEIKLYINLNFSYMKNE